MTIYRVDTPWVPDHSEVYHLLGTCLFTLKRGFRSAAAKSRTLVFVFLRSLRDQFSFINQQKSMNFNSELQN